MRTMPRARAVRSCSAIMQYLDSSLILVSLAMMYGLTLSLKNEIVAIAPKGRVNSVAPGWVYTPMAEESLKDPDIVYRSLATCVSYLCSDAVRLM